MEQIFNEEELTNKTIKKAMYGEDNKFFLIFENSFCILKGTGWELNDIEIDNDEYNLIPTAYNCKELLKIGFITKEKADEIIKDYNKKNDDLKKRNELEKLAELKAKYPDFS